MFFRIANECPPTFHAIFSLRPVPFSTEEGRLFSLRSVALYIVFMGYRKSFNLSYGIQYMELYLSQADMDSIDHIMRRFHYKSRPCVVRCAVALLIEEEERKLKAKKKSWTLIDDIIAVHGEV